MMNDHLLTETIEDEEITPPPKRVYEKPKTLLLVNFAIEGGTQGIAESHNGSLVVS